MNTSAQTSIRFLDSGEAALTVELGSTISEDINRQVIALGEALAMRDLKGVEEIIPTYRSLLVLYDPLHLSRDALCLAVNEIWPHINVLRETGRRWAIPVCYGGEHGIDLEEVAQRHGMSPEELIARHSGATYRVYMIGFTPGFAYLGGLPQEIHTSRRNEPRARVPPRSILIGGKQAGICPPMEIPSGWHLLGQTPVRSYDPRRSDRPFLFEPGDIVRFKPITPEEYREMCAAAEAGEEVAKPEP